MLPLLRLASDGKEHRVREAVEQLSSELQLTEAERIELLPSGTTTVFGSRVGWARTYLKQAGLLHSAKRGLFQITNEGRVLLAEKPNKVDVKLLDRYEEFRAFRSRRRDSMDASESAPESEAASGQTPEDALAQAYRKLRRTLEADLLELIKAA